MKKLVFYLVVFTLTYALIEVCYFGIYRLANHRTFSFETEHRALNKVLNDAQIDRFGQQIVGVTTHSTDITLYPYLGFGPPAGLYDYAKNDSEVMVGITGGSVAQFFYDDTEAMQQLKYYIEAIPAYKGRPVHVVCLAFTSYKQPQQSIAVVLYLLFGGRLDILINLDGRNEIINALENQDVSVFYGYPYEQLWNDVVSPFRTVEEYHAIGRLTALRMLRRKWASVFAAITPFHYSVTALTLWEYGDRAFANRIDAIDQLRKSFNLNDKLKLRTGPYAPMTERELLNRAANTWTEGSLFLQKLAELNGFHYYHFLQPVPNLPGAKPFYEEEMRVVADEEEGKRDVKAYAKLQGEIPKLRKGNVNIYDITDLFSNTPDAVYVDSCCHVNHKGNMMFASKLGQTIMQDAAAWKPQIRNSLPH